MDFKTIKAQFILKLVEKIVKNFPETAFRFRLKLSNAVDSSLIFFTVRDEQNNRASASRSVKRDLSNDSLKSTPSLINALYKFRF